MGILAMVSRVWVSFVQPGRATALQARYICTRMFLLFFLLCSSPVLVPLILLFAIPLGIFLLAFVHLPGLWRRFRPTPFRRGLACHREKFGTPLPPPPPGLSNADLGQLGQSEEIPNPPPSPTCPAYRSGSWPIEDARDSKETDRQGRAPADDERLWHGKDMQEALMLSGSTSPSDFAPSPRSPPAGQDDSAALTRSIRMEITSLKRFLGDESPSRGSLLKEIEDLGTFLGIDLPIATTPEADLQKAKECVQLLQLVVGVQFR